jgi:DNA ligase (NAD+)
MNIDGLSEATLEKLIAMGWINGFEDIYKLNQHEKEMQMLDGFGRKSVEKLLQSIQNSKQTDFAHFLNALGVPGCGKSNSKDIAAYCKGDFETFLLHMDIMGANEFANIDGIGQALVLSMNTWYLIGGRDLILNLIDTGITMKVDSSTSTYNKIDVDLSGNTYVITGSLNRFENRDQLKALIESLGGKVGSGVTAKTTVLINNDVNSNSGKNKKAKELGIQIWSEQQFLDSIGY